MTALILCSIIVITFRSEFVASSSLISQECLVSNNSIDVCRVFPMGIIKCTDCTKGGCILVRTPSRSFLLPQNLRKYVGFGDFSFFDIS